MTSTQGITWTFSAAKQVGQYANGDWWVVGPIVLTAISPEFDGSNRMERNGSTVNPGVDCQQGYDSTAYEPVLGAHNYVASLNLAKQVKAANGAGVSVPANSSIISAISHPNGYDTNSRTSALAYSILTVVGQIPRDGDFRPPYVGSGSKTSVYNIRHIDYSIFRNFALPTGFPAWSVVENKVYAYPVINHCNSQARYTLYSKNGLRNYYRETGVDLGVATLMLNGPGTNAQKQKTIIGLAQMGIDNYASWLLGINQNCEVNHCANVKGPIVFAGAALALEGHDAWLMKTLGHDYPLNFYGPTHQPPNGQLPLNMISNPASEDLQTFYVQTTGTNQTNWGYGGYTADQVNQPEWANSHATDISNDDARWADGNHYRYIWAGGQVGWILAFRMMGLKDAWNHNALFEYFDWYMSTHPDTGMYDVNFNPLAPTLWSDYPNPTRVYDCTDVSYTAYPIQNSWQQLRQGL